MSIILVVFFFGFLLSPQPARAQHIPLFYQLLKAYYPIVLWTNQAISFSSTPDSLADNNPDNQVLGVATSLPPIGGEGDITTIALLGDSMIDTLGDDIPALESALKQYFPAKKFHIINYGVGASHIEYALFRLKNDYQYLGQTHQSLLSLKPDIIVVESFAYNNFGNTQEGIDRQWLSLGAITTTIRQQLPDAKIILAATIAPNSVTFGNGIPDYNLSAMEKIERTNTIKLYLQNLLNFATSQNFPLADAYTPSLQDGQGLPELISSTDHLHPSSQGGQLFCDIIAQTIHQHHLLD